MRELINYMKGDNFEFSQTGRQAFRRMVSVRVESVGNGLSVSKHYGTTAEEGQVSSFHRFYL